MKWRAATRVADCDVHKIAASTIDWSSLREDFPILREQAHGHPLIYFDSAATSQKPRPVIEALRNFYEHDNANVHRGLHMLSSRATEAYEKARQRVAEYIGAASADEIIFTRGTTESINLVAQAWGGKFIREGDVILLTEDREILSKSAPINVARNSLMHAIICYTADNALVPRWNALSSISSPPFGRNPA